MSYAAIKAFSDSQDNYHIYQAGDNFPRDGKSVNDKRIAELEEKSFIKKVEVAVERNIEQKPKRTTAKSKSKE